MSEFEEHVAAQQRLANEYMQTARAKDEIKKAEFEGLIDSLSAEQLVTLHSMLGYASVDSEYGYQLSGVISGCLIYKHGRSWNGDASPLADTGEAFVRAMHQAAGRPVTDLEKLNAIEEDKIAAQMVEYNVVPDTANEGYFKCGNCGMFIMSLEDRMLRPAGPLGCPGCREKAKFG